MKLLARAQRLIPTLIALALIVGISYATLVIENTLPLL